jgi:hypothetical protein
MKKAGLIGRALVVLGLCATAAHASDPMALYARVDRVVIEAPSKGRPTSSAIQIWGVFALAKPGDRNDYLAPVRGYLYFRLTDNGTAALAEWADLQKAAGTGQIVSLGSRYELRARVRQADERPEKPDPYVVSFGLMKARQDSGNPPVRALRAFPR